jgi:hypothetical protein
MVFVRYPQFAPVLGRFSVRLDGGQTWTTLFEPINPGKSEPARHFDPSLLNKPLENSSVDEVDGSKKKFTNWVTLGMNYWGLLGIVIIRSGTNPPVFHGTGNMFLLLCPLA